MNPEAPSGPSQPSTSSSSFQAQFPYHSQNLPCFSATVKFPMTSPTPFQCIIGLQPLNPYFYQFRPSSSPEGFSQQNPTEPSYYFGPDVIDRTKNSQGIQGQNDSNIFNGRVVKCAFSDQQIDPLTKKCSLVSCICQGPNGNYIANGGAKTTKSPSARKIQNCSKQTQGDVPAIEGAKNSSVQVIRCCAIKPVSKELPKKFVNEIGQDRKESVETVQQTERLHQMEKEPETSRASIPLLDNAEEDVLNEAPKKAMLIRPRARGMFNVISGKASEKNEEIAQFSAKLVDMRKAEDKEVEEPIKKRKKPGPKSKKHY